MGVHSGRVDAVSILPFLSTGFEKSAHIDRHKLLFWTWYCARIFQEKILYEDLPRTQPLFLEWEYANPVKKVRHRVRKYENNEHGRKIKHFSIFFEKKKKKKKTCLPAKLGLESQGR